MESQGRVVLVDDNEDDMELATLVLNRAGVRDVKTFTDGEEFCSYLQGLGSDALPQAILLDVKMPGMNGLDVLEWIRARSLYDRIPVVMLSSSDDPRDIATAARLKAQCYVAKHPTLATIKDIMASAGASDNSGPDRIFQISTNLLLERDTMHDVASA